MRFSSYHLEKSQDTKQQDVCIQVSTAVCESIVNGTGKRSCRYNEERGCMAGEG